VIGRLLRCLLLLAGLAAGAAVALPLPGSSEVRAVRTGITAPDTAALFETWEYDGAGRRTNANIALDTYLWNAQGLRSREDATVTTSVLSCRFEHTYDRLGRLTRTLIGNGPGGNPCPAPGDWTYTYDAVGNRLTEGTPIFPAGSSTFTYDANDRLISVTGKKQAAYAYDAAGNLVKRTLPPTVNPFIDQVSEFRWDAEGRLVTLLPPNEQGEPIDYLYDAEGQLVRETRRATTGTLPPPANVTTYLPDRNLAYAQIVEERDGTGALKVAYQFADGRIVKQVRSGVSSFYHQDHLSVGQLTDASGNVVNRYLYSPFGEVIHQAGTGSLGAPGVANSYLFAGERLNSDSGLYYLRARWMDPRVGRFAGIDPHPAFISRPVTLNDYVYAADDPVNNTDPSGQVIGLMSITLTNFNITYGRSVETKKRFDTFDKLRTNLCQSMFKISSNVAGHHSFPKFLGGADKQALARIPEEIHIALHQLLSVALVMNGFHPASAGKAVFTDLFSQGGNDFKDAMKVLRNVTKFVDSACVGKYSPKIESKLEPLLNLAK